MKTKSTSRHREAATMEGSVLKVLAQTVDVANPRLSLVGEVAYLEGTVHCYQDKSAASDIIKLLTGATEVVNRLRVVPSQATGDRALRDAVKETLESQLGDRAEKLSITTSSGVVELKGKVTSLAERFTAESAVWSVGGVVDVRNYLEVQGRATSTDILARQLRQALAQCLRLTLTDIEVMMMGDTVYLRGKVPTHLHRLAAEDLVRSHSAVGEVFNELLIEEESPALLSVEQSRASA